MNRIIITRLGTISPYTKGNMNCSGFLVEYNFKKILLDCGIKNYSHTNRHVSFL